MIKFKLYYDKDKEQDWLNAMSKLGWAFENFFLGFYFFQRCRPGEYLYQIDISSSWSAEYQDYTIFMEESGVEVLSTWYRWIYLRKKASDGPFELYTDIDSKIAMYQRIKAFFFAGFVLESVAFFFEVAMAMESGSILLYVLSILLGGIALLLLQKSWKCSWKIASLEREKMMV